MVTIPSNTTHKDQIITQLQLLLSSNSYSKISQIETSLNKLFTSPVECAQELLDYITNNKDKTNASIKQDLSLMIIIWLNKSIKQSHQSKLIKDDDAKRLLLLYFNTIVLGTHNVKVINHLSRLFEFLLNQSSPSTSKEVMGSFISYLYTTHNENPFCLSYFTGLMQIISIATDILIKRINTEIKHLNDIFVVIEKFLREIADVYESIAQLYIDNDYNKLSIAVAVINQLYSYYNTLLKSKPDVVSKVRNIIKLSTIINTGTRIIFIGLPSKSQCLPMIWSNSKEFDMQLNTMKIGIYKVITQIVKDQRLIESNIGLIEVNKTFLAKNLLFFEVIINKSNYFKSIKEREGNIQSSIYSKFISIALAYCLTMIKISPFNSFLFPYQKQFLKGIIAHLLALSYHDEEMIHLNPKEYLVIIEDAGESCKYKQYKTMSALILREICKKEIISDYFLDYLVNHLNNEIEVYYQSKSNQKEDTRHHRGIEIASGLLLFYLMPKSTKSFLSMKTLIKQHNLFEFAKCKSTPFVIKLHFSLLIKKYYFDLYDVNDPDLISLIQYLVCNTDNNHSAVLSQLSSKAIKLLYQNRNSFVNSKILSEVTDILIQSNSDKRGSAISPLQFGSFIGIIAQILKQSSSINSKEMIKAFQVICLNFNLDCNELMRLLKMNKTDDDVLNRLAIETKSLKTIIKRESFIQNNINEIDIEIDRHLIPLINYSSLHCYDEIIDLLIQYTLVKRDMSNELILGFNNAISVSLIKHEEIPSQVFELFIALLVYGNKSQNNNDNNQYEGIINLFQSKINRIEEGSTNAFKAAMLMALLLRNKHQVKPIARFNIQKITQIASKKAIEIAEKVGQSNETSEATQVTFAALMILVCSGFIHYPHQMSRIINIEHIMELNSKLCISNKYTILKKLLIEGLCSMLKYDLTASKESTYLDELLKLIIDTKENEIDDHHRVNQIEGEEERNGATINKEKNLAQENSEFDKSIIEISEFVAMKEKIDVFSLFIDVIKVVHCKDSKSIQNWIRKLIEEKRFRLKILLHLKTIALLDKKQVLFFKTIDALNN